MNLVGGIALRAMFLIYATEGTGGEEVRAGRAPARVRTPGHALFDQALGKDQE